MEISIIAVGAFLILTTVLSAVRTPRWWVRVCDFPRLQSAVLLALTLAGAAWVARGGDQRFWILAAALAACLLYQLARILPFTPLVRRESLPAERRDPGSRLSLLVANVLMHNRDFPRLCRLIEAQQPDLVLLLETDAGWEEALRPLEEAYPETVKHPLGNTYGLLFYSRRPLTDVETRFLVEDDVPSIRCRVELPDGRRVRFYGLHPRPPQVRSDTAERDAELVLVGREARRTDEPTVVAGDMNDVAWSFTTRLFQRVSGLLDPRVGRGMYNTFHASIPLVRYPLDHVFHSRELRLVRLARGPAVGSDHFPILAELSLEPERAGEQPEPEEDAEDREEERRILEEVGEENRLEEVG